MDITDLLGHTARFAGSVLERLLALAIWTWVTRQTRLFKPSSLGKRRAKSDRDD